MFQFIQTFITTSKEQEGQVIVAAGGGPPKLQGSKKGKPKVISEYQSIASALEQGKKKTSTSIQLLPQNSNKIQMKTERQGPEIPIGKIEILGSKPSTKGFSDKQSNLSLIQKHSKHQSNKESIQSMSTVTIDDSHPHHNKKQEGQQQASAAMKIADSPTKKYSKKISPHGYHQAELEDRPMNESLRHTILIDEDEQAKKLDNIIEALDQYKKEIQQQSPEKRDDRDQRKTIVLVDGQIPANFGMISSQQMKKLKTENNIMPQILKDYPETTYESERSSIFAENTMIPEEQITMRETKYLEKLQTAVQQNIAQTQGLAFIAGTQNLKLMECLNTTLERGNKIQQYLELNMRMQNLKELKESLFFKNQYIRTLDLRNNLIKQLPEAICELSLLWKLRIDFNILEQLPENIGKLQKLEVLTVSSNKLKTLPSSLFQLGDSLNILLMNDNDLKRLPYSIRNLKNLKSLLIHNNQLRKLPCDLSHLRDLHEFSSEWFSYVVPQVNKVLKDERGKLIIKDFQKFCLQIHEILRKNHQLRSIKRKNNLSFSFIHFLAHFNKVSSISDLLTLKPFSKNRSLLHQFFLNGHLHLLKEYLSCSTFDPSCLSVTFDEDQSSPLLLAVKNKHSSFLEYLINSDSFAPYQLNMTHPSTKYGPCLHIALKNHDFKLISLILGNSRCQTDLAQVDSEGNNLLHVLMGSQFGQGGRESAAIAVKLIRKGVDLNGLNHSQLSPLHLAIKKFQNKSLKFALDFNLHQLKKNHDKLFDLNLQCGKNDACQTPLHIAVSNSNLSAVNLLVSYVQVIAEKQYDPKFVSFLQMRDSEYRLPQEMCPYNSPVAKIVTHCQTRLLQILRTNRPEMIVSPQMPMSHTAVNRRHRNKMKTNHHAYHKSYSQETFKRNFLGSRIQNNASDEKFFGSPFEVYQGKMARDLSVSIPHQQRSSNLVQSRTEKELNRLNVNQPTGGDVSVMSIAKYDSQNEKNQARSEKLHKYSPRILQKLAPLPPKMLIPFNFQEREDVLLRQTCDQMFDMEELTKSMEVVEEDIAHRFMSHQVNFESGQTIQQDALKKQLAFTRSIYERESLSSGISSLESESSEERKSGIFSYRCASALRSSSIANYRVGSKMYHNYQSAPQSVKPSIATSRLGSDRSSKVRDHKNLDDFIEDSNSTVLIDPIQLQNRQFSGVHELEAAHHPMDLSSPQQKNVQPLIQAIQALKDQSKTPKNGGSIHSSEDEDICDAAVDEDEPEAGSMGQIIAKKINKFENGQINEAEYRSQNYLKKMVQIVKEINEIKQEKKNKGKEDILLVNPNYQGRNCQSNQQVTTLQSFDDDNTFEAIFDSTQQLFIEKSRQDQLVPMHSKPLLNNHAIDYLLRDGLQLKNKMKELNKDCFINTEQVQREKILGEVKGLLVVLQDPNKELSIKYRLFYSFYHSLFNFSASPVASSFPSSAADQPLSQLIQSERIPFILRLDMINLLRSKLMIPHLEQQVNLMYSQMEEESSPNNYEKIWLSLECKNAIRVLTREAMEESKSQMERCNTKIKIERERSRERMRKQVRGISQNDDYKDKANLSDEKINNETESANINHQTSNVKVLNQSASAFSIREVPEFVARLNKSPSQTSIYGGAMLRNNSTTITGLHAQGTKNESAYSHYTQINVSNFKHQVKQSPFHQYWQQSTNNSSSSKLLFNVNQPKFPPFSAIMKKSQTPKEPIPSTSTSISQAFQKFSDQRKYYFQQSHTPVAAVSNQDTSNNNKNMSYLQMNTSRNNNYFLQNSSSVVSLKIKQPPRSTRSPQPPQSLNHSNFMQPLPTNSESDSNSIGRRISPHFPGAAISAPQVVLQADLNYPIVIKQKMPKKTLSNVTAVRNQQQAVESTSRRRQQVLIHKKSLAIKNNAVNKKH